jgi:uncharacterized protein (DUF58 family)
MEPLLDLAELSRLGSLHLRARSVVEGALSGLHRSARHGSSAEFAEHKEYSQGDEVRRIDWKAYGKSDRYYLKRFEDDTELCTYLLIDSSASMGYGEPQRSKLDYARTLAASLAYLLVQQRDRVGFIGYGAKVSAFVPAKAKSGQLGDLLQILEKLSASGATDLPRAISYLSEVAERRALLCVFSDFFDSASESRGSLVRTLLRGLRARRHDVIVFHTLHPDELTLPFEGATRFLPLEGDGGLVADPAQIRRAYLEELRHFTEAYRRGLTEGDVEYHLCDTSEHPAERLRALLATPLRRRTRR